MFGLKFSKIYLNIVSKMVVFSIQYCILIELIYNQLVNLIIVNNLKIKIWSKENS